MENKICVLGLGYIGLPTAVIFAQNGWMVTGVDVNSNTVSSINSGKSPIKENGLDIQLKQIVMDKKLKASYTPTHANVFIIAVPTPHDKDNTANLSIVQAAIKSILPYLRRDNIIILESTVPPRTTRDVVAPILERAGFIPGEDVYLAYCPERVLPGRILVELIENNRIIGGINEISAKKAADVYRTFVEGNVIETIAESAEMSKLMENTYRDVNIALANELSKISEYLNIDTHEVIALANEHPRVNVHQPGPGVGGHCIAVDPYFIIEKDPINTNLIRTARSINESMPRFVVNQVDKIVQTPAKITIFGLAFKGNVDDIRNSPSLEIIDILKEKGHQVLAHDPYVRQEQVDIKLFTFEEALKSSDLLIVLTDHDEFKSIDWNRVVKLMNKVIVFDPKNCISNFNDEIQYINYSNLNSIDKTYLIEAK